MLKKTLTIKNKNLDKFIQRGGRKQAEENFIELLRRAAKPANKKKR